MNLQTRAQKNNINDFPYIEYSESGGMLYVENQNNSWTQYIYNDLENVAEIRSSNGSWIKYYYDEYGNLIDVIESDGLREDYVYDYEINKPIRYIRRAGKKTYSEFYEYDTDGNMTYKYDTNGHWEKREFDNGILVYFESSERKNT